MSGTQKHHFAVDLNEIERQLAQAQQGTPSPAAGGRHDPLADLARIVGQSDPYQDLLAEERPRSRGFSQDQRSPSASGPYAQRREPPPFDFAEEMRQSPAVDGSSYAYQQPSSAPSHEEGAYDQQVYDQGGYAQDYYDPQAEQATAPYDASAYQSPGRSRKTLLAMGAVLGIIVVGSAGAFIFSGGSAAVTGGEPPLIAASNEPVKVAPQNPGGVEIPNQNKQIYERAQSGDTKVVSNSEQPVDVKQTVRMNGGSATEATGSAGPAKAAPAGLNLGEPRKVRTIAIKPDGTLARPEPAARTAAVASPPPMSMPVSAQPAAKAPSPAPAPAATPAPVAAPRPAAATPTEAPAAASQRVASVQPTAPAATATPAEASVGGFSVQLAVRGTEKDAQAAFSQFQKKYAELAGQAPMIRKAEVNGNTIYRVRAGPMSRDDASSLCSSVQGQGGQCFVAKN